MLTERGIRNAPDYKEFVLFYQPVFNVSDGKVRGFEALLRWIKADGSVVFPDEFIGVAEESGVIVPIGAWVLHEACRFNRKLFDAGFKDMMMSVNISAVQLGSKGLLDVIKSALQESGLCPELLEIEVTEDLFIQSFDMTRDILNKIKDIGVHVSLDGFGTGASSLGYLQRLPITNLKIDRPFIREITKNSDENLMFPAIVALAHQLKRRVVAVGVETEIQLDKLAGSYCDYYQGYFCSKPIPAAGVLAFLRREERGDLLKLKNRVTFENIQERGQDQNSMLMDDSAAQTQDMEKKGLDMTGASVLIVDDEPFIGSALKRELSGAGYYVESVLSGMEAVEAVKQKKYGVVLIDQVMPDLDGVETCKAIKKISPESVFIYMTGLFDRDNVVKERQFAEAGGRVYFLYKPFAQGEVQDTVKMALSRKE